MSKAEKQIVQSISKNDNTRNIKKLEIWGKAQRESARRPKSDWGKLRWGKEGGRISPA